MADTTFTKDGWTFAQVPIGLMLDKTLSDGAKVLFAYLAWRQGTSDNAWPSVGRMADDMNVSNRAIQRRVRELQDQGWLTVTERSGHSNLYTIHATPQRDNSVASPVPTPDASDTPTPDTSVTQNDSHLNDKKPTAATQRRKAKTGTDTQHRAIYSALRTVCYLDDSLESNQGRLNRTAKEIRASGKYTADDIVRWYGRDGWWYRHYWKGQKGERPEPEMIPKTLGEARLAMAVRQERTVAAPVGWSSALTGERNNGNGKQTGG